MSFWNLVSARFPIALFHVCFLCIPLSVAHASGVEFDKLHAEIFGKRKQTQVLVLPVYLQSLQIGESRVWINEREELEAISTQDFLSVLKAYAVTDYLEQIAELDNDARILASLLSDIELSANFDPSDLRVVIDFPPQYSILQNKSYGSLAPEWGKNPEPPEAYSGFLNYTLSSDWQWTDKQPRQHSETIDLEAAFNVHGLVFETEARLQEGRGWSFGDSFFTYDQPSHDLRYRLGELPVSTISFQRASPLAGFSVEKSFDLRPYQVTRPRNRNEFLLAERSTVSIYLNGRLYDRVVLNAGRHAVEDLSLPEGNSNVLVVAEGLSGRIERFEFEIAVASRLLREGLSEFSFTLGFPYQTLSSGRSYLWRSEKLSGLAFYRLGLEPNLTVSAFGQFDENVIMLGSEFIYASRFGNLAVEFARSELSSYEGGYQAAFNYDYLFGNHLNTQVSYDLDLISASFSALGTTSLPMNADRAKHVFSIVSDLGYDVSGSFSSSYSQFRGSGQTDTFGISSQFSRSWFSGFRASIRLSIDKSVEGVWDKGVVFSLNSDLPFDRQNISFNQDTLNRTRKTSWNRHPSDTYGDIDMGLSYREEEQRDSLDGVARYSGHRSEFSLGLGRNYPRKSGGSQRDELSINVSGALAFTNYGAGFSRRINDSYAMVVTGNPLKGNTLGVNALGGGLQHEAYASDFLPAIVSDLQAYRYERLLLDSSTLDQGATLDREQYVLLPTYKSAYAFKVGDSAAVVLVGRLVNVSKEPLSLTVGTIESQGATPSSVPLFTNRKGKFVAEGLAPGDYLIKLDGISHEPVALTIPASAHGIYNVKNLEVEFDDH